MQDEAKVISVFSNPHPTPCTPHPFRSHSDLGGEGEEKEMRVRERLRDERRESDAIKKYIDSRHDKKTGRTPTNKMASFKEGDGGDIVQSFFSEDNAREATKDLEELALMNNAMEQGLSLTGILGSPMENKLK
jgi:hypothetical protein